MKNLVVRGLAVLAVVLAAQPANAVPYSASVVVTELPGGIYNYEYTIQQHGPGSGFVSFVLPVNTVIPMGQPAYLPLSWSMPHGWIFDPYNPVGFGPANPEIVFNGGWLFSNFNPDPEPTSWTVSFRTHYAPHTAGFFIQSGWHHPFTNTFGEIAMPAYDGTIAETLFVDGGTAVPDATQSGLLLCFGMLCTFLFLKRIPR